MANVGEKAGNLNVRVQYLITVERLKYLVSF
jgi:hypothetical protein